MSGESKGIWAVILAAGESVRMGTPKMLLPFRGSTMLGESVRNVKESEAEGIMVVLGAEKIKTEEIAEKLSVSHCYNADYKQGMLSSVKCGLRHLPQILRAIMVFPGDQPLITTRTIDRVIEAYNDGKAGIVIPVYMGRRGHPLLVDGKYRDEIMNISPDTGLKALAEKFHDDVTEIETDDPGILKDFDTLDDYKNEINQYS